MAIQFTAGQWVQTPKGEGAVIYQRMAPPSYSRPEAVSVEINGRPTIFAADQVAPILIRCPTCDGWGEVPAPGRRAPCLDCTRKGVVVARDDPQRGKQE